MVPLPPVPEEIGPYRIVRRLGQGGMGTVYDALDTTLDRHVALKMITPARADDADLRVRFRQEARMQAALDSPHVVQVYAHGEVAGRLYIASQLVPDGDLGAWLRRGALPPGLAEQVVAQVADGLAEAHRVGVVHRDVKPANVLLRKRGPDVVAYLADFGVAERACPAGPGVVEDVRALGRLIEAVLPRRRTRAVERIVRAAGRGEPTAADVRDALAA